MALEEILFSSTCGPPTKATTSASKDVGIYCHTILPSWAAKASFKKSSTPPHCLAVSRDHVFAAQDQKALLHVYSRLRGSQEAVVSFPERIRCLVLAGHVLILGTAQGRLILWDVSQSLFALLPSISMLIIGQTCTGRQISTPPCHLQAVSCLAVTPYHLLSGAEDSNIHVWSLAPLLDIDAGKDHEPTLTLANHRAAITDLAVGSSANAETSFCLSASRDKTCILSNYCTGHVLRTVLFPATPLCLSLDPCSRAFFSATEDGCLYLVEFFGDKPLLGPRSAELASVVVQVGSPLGVADADAGAPSCMTLSYDGTYLLTGHAKGLVLRWTLADGRHPTQVADLNASVTNLISLPLLPADPSIRLTSVVKPDESRKQYAVTAQLEGQTGHAFDSRFHRLINSTGIQGQAMEDALQAFCQSSTPAA